MVFNKKLTQLNDALSTLIIFPNETIPFLIKANINPSIIDFSGGSFTFWSNIIHYAYHNVQLEDLVDAVLSKFPKNPFLLSYKSAILEDYSMGPDIRKDIPWHEDDELGGDEKITENISTLLPVFFLNKGVEKAKSVARIIIRKQNKNELGSAFLLPDNLILTNNHVIPDIQTALLATVQFNYEESESGTLLEHTDFKLDPENGFATSLVNDWSVVRVKGDANKLFGVITIKPNSIQKGDFVNIIQHPAGGLKQIGLYHNIVTYSDERIVQYLTDTEPGSSGSPVFNSEWEVVALHHSGGNLLEPGTKQKLLRNEGININTILKDLKNIHL